MQHNTPMNRPKPWRERQKSDESLPWLEPAATVVRKLGGPPVAAQICGVRVSSVYRWLWPLTPTSGDMRGSGGMIPARHQIAILEWSKRNGNPVRPEDFFVRPSNAA